MRPTLTLLTALLLTPLAALHAAEKKPNILIILADDLGYGDVGCYGGKIVPTPNIDRLAAGGVRCTDGYVAAPVCAPSRVGLLSGSYPQRIGVHWNEDVFPQALPGLRLPKEHLTLPEVLHSAGYVTGHLGKWNFPRDARIACDEVEDLMNFGGEYFPGVDGQFKGVNDGPADKNYEQGVFHTLKEGEEYLTDRIGRHACEFIQRRRGQEKPFFLYLAFNAPHSPYQAKAAQKARFGGIRPEPLNVYAAMVASLDENVGRVLDTLRTERMLDDTLIVFTSDNGPAPPLHVGWKAEWPADLTVGSAGPLSGRKAQFLEGGIREPFIVHWPARLNPGVYRRPVSTLDLYPTLCAAAGASIPAAVKPDGVDILPHLRGVKTGDPHERLFWGKLDKTGGDQILGAVREGDWKLIIQHWKPKIRLFNLAADPGEKNDLATNEPERVKALQQAWKDWSMTLAPPASGVAKSAKSKTVKTK
jgi:arylsulfatase A-like enzyme